LLDDLSFVQYVGEVASAFDSLGGSPVVGATWCFLLQWSIVSYGINAYICVVILTPVVKKTMHTDNYCVIMGGGVGSRFWPYSREAKPKQFLDIFATGRTLLQMTYDRFSKVIPKENFVVVTNAIYRDLVLEQLPELTPGQILLEPMRRNTAPCIGWATYHIYAKNPNANVLVTPADHLILQEDAFDEAICRSLDYVKAHPKLVTLGVRPSRPETGYGYIQFTDIEDEHFVKVKTFTEKPNIEMAKVFYESGEFLWNSGMFAWNVQTILDAFHQYLPSLTSILDEVKGAYATDEEQSRVSQVFSECPNISIDYAVLEKADNVMVLPVDFGWADLGTWGSLYELKREEPRANVSLHTKALFYEAEGNIVSLDGDPEKQLVVVQGINDCIVAQSKGVLLICKRDKEQRIKEFMGEASVQFDKKFD